MRVESAEGAGESDREERTPVIFAARIFRHCEEDESVTLHRILSRPTWNSLGSMSPGR